MASTKPARVGWRSDREGGFRRCQKSLGAGDVGFGQRPSLEAARVGRKQTGFTLLSGPGGRLSSQEVAIRSAAEAAPGCRLSRQGGAAAMLRPACSGRRERRGDWALSGLGAFGFPPSRGSRWGFARTTVGAREGRFEVSKCRGAARFLRRQAVSRPDTSSVGFRSSAPDASSFLGDPFSRHRRARTIHAGGDQRCA